jgi:hypothetical protein
MNYRIEVCIVVEEKEYFVFLFSYSAEYKNFISSGKLMYKINN